MTPHRRTSDTESGSALLPAEFQPSNGSLLDACDGSCTLECTRWHASTLPILCGTIVESAGVTPTDDTTSFGALLSFYFHELLTHLNLLEESYTVSAESSEELTEEVRDFRADQLSAIGFFLQRNAGEIFDDSAAVGARYAIKWDSAPSRAILSVILSNLQSQSFIFEAFYERVRERPRHHSVQMPRTPAVSPSRPIIPSISTHPTTLLPPLCPCSRRAVAARAEATQIVPTTLLTWRCR
jgi:hypothetical protein